ncbi:MFS transporter [Acinetobacter lwoffii]|uniref:MFS transporter n=1 Tax=Acinetobacter lwoffii TaxID=28090 RepID=UPI003BF70794
MSCVCSDAVRSPILGALSDRFGRRPVLIISIAGATADYLLMAAAPSLLWPYIGRIFAGITGANMAVATAYVSDITPAHERAKRFGLLGAVFGIGFIAGPVIGGVWVNGTYMHRSLLLLL